MAYLLELSRNESFENSNPADGQGTHFEWTGASPGRYYMRIATIDQYKRKGPYSNVSTVLVRPNPPDLNLPKTKLKVTEEKKATLFSWSSVENSSEYEFQIAKDSNFSRSWRKRRPASRNLNFLSRNPGITTGGIKEPTI
ncbi:MAG: hypothetical protein R3B54_15715 [Bdellovibrionota bacterium]